MPQQRMQVADPGRKFQSIHVPHRRQHHHPLEWGRNPVQYHLQSNHIHEIFTVFISHTLYNIFPRTADEEGSLFENLNETKL